MTDLLVVLAGALGAVARLLVDTGVRARTRSALPVGTLVINTSGCLLLGLLTGLQLRGEVAPDVLLVAGTGFCGGYTTFSTASVEAVRLLAERRGLAAAYVVLTVALALSAAGLGLLVTR
ncbi:CrcB protein [Motilibacter rhizosphaerae]|uniref:Fluoride-specific ion channel FluC n=1 Tax=Motilibacter rhizosphaerae TaxID=598652 RepID=A0A4Q7NT95_9ACTN|nr:CrcB family protein [Motilibacter rhizosphaerae]RZS90110.1 CrcB protein [Motilibacter rhizosphaerae]